MFTSASGLKVGLLQIPHDRRPREGAAAPRQPTVFQGGLSQLHPQEPGSGGRSGRGALNWLSADPGEDTPRQLRL